MTLTDQSRLRLSEDVTFQSMGGDEQTVILSLSSGFLYTCNGITCSFLQVIDAERTFGEILDELTDEYEVSRDLLRKDLTSITEMMLSEKLILMDQIEAT